MTLINKICLSYLSPMLKRVEKSRREPMLFQSNCFENLLRNGTGTRFGADHHFSSILTIRDFQKKVPVRDYNAFQPYIHRLRSGEHYVLWNQKVKWFAKSSGTSSDKSKYIPITPDNLRECHLGGFKRLVGSYLQRHPQSRLLSGKALTLGGSVQLDDMNNHGTFSGDLSAILLKNSPRVAEWVRTPSRETALIAHFQEKIEKICRLCSKQNVTNFAGVPSWNLVLINRLLEYNRVRHLTDIWPNLELFMHGGINFEPYRAQYREIIPGDTMNYVESYNASEGYFAFQDDEQESSMLLTLDNGVFYEFIPMDKYHDALIQQPVELDTIESVSVNKPYAVVISTNSGLWRYLIGDCVEFTSLYPHKIKITGRTQLYLNAFGEELMISNVENALAKASLECNVSVIEYTVAPVYMERGQKGAHQWLIEFRQPPGDMDAFTDALDKALCSLNSDYEAKRTNNTTILRPHVVSLPEGTFLRWMKKQHKVGGQNKIPRLFNDRHFVEELLAIREEASTYLFNTEE